MTETYDAEEDLPTVCPNCHYKDCICGERNEK